MSWRPVLSGHRITGNSRLSFAFSGVWHPGWSSPRSSIACRFLVRRMATTGSVSLSFQPSGLALRPGCAGKTARRWRCRASKSLFPQLPRRTEPPSVIGDALYPAMFAVPPDYDGWRKQTPDDGLSICPADSCTTGLCWCGVVFPGALRAVELQVSRRSDDMAIRNDACPLVSHSADVLSGFGVSPPAL